MKIFFMLSSLSIATSPPMVSGVGHSEAVVSTWPRVDTKNPERKLRVVAASLFTLMQL